MNSNNSGSTRRFSGDVELYSGKHVLAVPYPGRGHLNPMITFSNLLASRGLRVTLVLTEEWLGSISSPGFEPAPSPSLQLRCIPNVVPSDKERTANFLSFVDAIFTKMGSPFERFLDQLEVPVSIIIADAFLPWAITAGNRRNIPVAMLWPMAPSFFSLLFHFDLVKSNMDVPEGGEDRIDNIPGVSSTCIADLPSILTAPEEAKLLSRFLEAMSAIPKANSLLFTSFYELEPKPIDSLRASLKFPLYPIGPSIPLTSPGTDKADASYIDWLDSQPEGSVLYISLGSFSSVFTAQMDEIAEGLRASGVRFLWAGRDEASRLQEICGEMGLVAPWCNQSRVLHHQSVAGFMTNGGWNSVLEAIYVGVPLLVFPMFAEATYNGKLVEEDWKIGLRVRSKGGAGNLVKREEIAKIVKRLMSLDEEESKERKGAKELKQACLKAMEKDGSSSINVDAFLEKVVLGGDH